MPGFIKTPRDERLWSKAKARAAAEGKTEQWPYITGIFKHMKGGSIGKSAGVVESLAKILRPISGQRLSRLHREAMGVKREAERLQALQFGKYDKATTRAEKFHGFRAAGKDPKEAKWVPHISKPMMQGAGMGADIAATEAKSQSVSKALETAEKRQDKARNIKLGLMAALTGAGIGGAYLHKKRKAKKALEQTKEASDDKQIDWRKLLAISAASGIAMGLSKGLMEKRIETTVRNLIAKRKEFPFKAEVPWSVSRGATGGIGALAGAASVGLGLSKKKKKKK